MSKTLINKQDRSKLSEGKTTGMGFAFLKKIDNNTYETVQPISTCKDYLNDVVYCEFLKGSVAVYGLSYKYTSCLDGDEAYMAIKMLASGTLAPLEKDVNRLNENYKNVQAVLNWIESIIQVPTTKIESLKDNTYLVTFSKFWSENTYKISLFALLLRISQHFNGKDVKEFLNGPMSDLTDASLWLTAKLKLILLLKGAKIDQTMTKSQGAAIHDMGISSYIPVIE